MLLQIRHFRLLPQLQSSDDYVVQNLQKWSEVFHDYYRLYRSFRTFPIREFALHELFPIQKHVPYLRTLPGNISYPLWHDEYDCAWNHTEASAV